MVNKHATQWFLRFTLLALWFAGGAVHGQSVVLSFAPASGAPGTSVILTLTGANFLNATNFSIDPTTNILKNARFSKEEAVALLSYLGILLE